MKWMQNVFMVQQILKHLERKHLMKTGNLLDKRVCDLLFGREKKMFNTEKYSNICGTERKM